MRKKRVLVGVRGVVLLTVMVARAAAQAAAPTYLDPSQPIDARLSPPELHAGDPLKIDVDVSNISERAGDEVIQVYISFPKLPGALLRALRGFTRVHLNAGEQRHVKLSLGERDLSYVNQAGDRMLTAGEYVITVGGGQPGTSGTHADAHLRIMGEKKLVD